MAEKETLVKAICTVCKEEKECCHSLPLLKDGETWKSQPICRRCRADLAREAGLAGRFVRIHSLEASEREAKRRNEQLMVSLAPFLEKYSLKLKDKQKAEMGNKDKLKTRKPAGRKV